MKLERVHLQNFRCFDQIVINLHPRLTVFSAENGAGKTAILDSIAIGFGRFLTKLPGVSGIATKETDLRIVRDERRAPYLVIAWEATTHDGRKITWTAVRKRDASIKINVKTGLDPAIAEFRETGRRGVNEYAFSLIEADAAEESYFLPVIAYYGTNRAILEEVRRRRGFKKEFTRFSALIDALQPDSRFKAAFEWFNAMEEEERREKEKRRDFDYRLPELNVVRYAIEQMLPPGFSNPRTETRPSRFVINREINDEVRILRISQLSDGYRVILGLVMDLARRMAQANSKFTINGNQIGNPLNLPAIVLIDEVDLHLHPKWQQTVLSDLMRVFPDTQFIVTTHSPQVLSTVKRENIRIVGQNNNGQFIAEPPLAVTYGLPSGNVLHSVMMVDPQPPVDERHDLQRLTELVDQGGYADQEARDLMQKLINKLGEVHPQLQRLQRSIRRQKDLIPSKTQFSSKKIIE